MCAGFSPVAPLQKSFNRLKAEGVAANGAILDENCDTCESHMLTFGGSSPPVFIVQF